MFTILLNYYNNIKNWLLGFAALATGVLAVMFVFERNKAAIDDALVKEAKVTADLAAADAQIAKNNDSIKTEEQKQEDIKKEINNNGTTSTNNVIDFFNRNK